MSSVSDEVSAHMSHLGRLGANNRTRRSEAVRRSASAARRLNGWAGEPDLIVLERLADQLERAVFDQRAEGVTP